jgi:hypothetical protein
LAIELILAERAGLTTGRAPSAAGHHGRARIMPPSIGTIAPLT